MQLLTLEALWGVGSSCPPRSHSLKKKAYFFKYLKEPMVWDNREELWLQTHPRFSVNKQLISHFDFEEPLLDNMGAMK